MTDFAYKFRCECRADYDRIQNICGNEMRNVKIISYNNIPDCTIEFVSSLNIQSLLQKINSLEDAHVAFETLMPFSKYTGDRDCERNIKNINNIPNDPPIEEYKKQDFMRRLIIATNTIYNVSIITTENYLNKPIKNNIKIDINHVQNALYMLCLTCTDKNETQIMNDLVLETIQSFYKFLSDKIKPSNFDECKTLVDDLFSKYSKYNKPEYTDQFVVFCCTILNHKF